MTNYTETAAQITPGSHWESDTETIEVLDFDGQYALCRALTGSTVGTRYQTGLVNWDHFGARYRMAS